MTTSESRRTCVLGLIMCGLRTKQIADQLGWATQTIAHDRTILFRRHHVRTIPDLIRATWTRA